MSLHVGLNVLHLVPGETGGGETYVRQLVPALLEAREDLRLTLFAGDEAYPVASFTWLLVYKDQANEAKGRALTKFLWWMSHEGQKYADDLLYAPLPNPVVKQIEAKIKQITYQGKPLMAAR